MFATDEGRKAATLYRRYLWTWYLAAAGWAVAVLVVVGLLALLSRRTEYDESPPEPAPPDAPPPHRIT